MREADRRELERSRHQARYWREAYELLVEQTGRDLNDGYGRDPRRLALPAHCRVADARKAP